jgi:hypothetical protein
VVLQGVGEPVEHPRTLGRRCFEPVLERPSRGPDGTVHVLFRAFRHRCDDLPRRRVQDLPPLSVRSLDELSIDEGLLSVHR